MSDEFAYKPGSVGRYRKKPVVIDAVQLCWRNWNEVCDFLGNVLNDRNSGRHVKTYSDTCGEPGPDYIELTIPTLEGDHVAQHGDWIIRGVKGEFYPCKPDIFDATYEPEVTWDTEHPEAGVIAESSL